MPKKRIDLSEQCVIVHNLTLKGIEKIPGVLDFDQRGILSVRSGDTLLTKRQIDPEYLRYLSELGYDFSGVSFLSPESISHYTYRSIYYDKQILTALRKSAVAYIDSYQNTIEEGRFSERIGKPIYASTEIGKRYGTKSGFRALAKGLKMQVPFGYESVKGIRETLARCLDIFNRGASYVVIKIDEGLSGAGSTVISKSDFIPMGKSEQKEKIRFAISRVPQFNSTSAISVEEWRTDAIASPSVQMEVTPDGAVLVLSMHDQILEGLEKWYTGCVQPVQSVGPAVQKQLVAQAIAFTKVLMNKGFIGFLGLDSIVTKDNDIYWVEANVRKPGTYYPRVIAEKLHGGSIKGVFYTARDFTVSKLRGRPFHELKTILKKYLYPMRSLQTGIILYNTGALRDAGRFDLISLAKDRERADFIFNKVARLISTL